MSTGTLFLSVRRSRASIVAEVNQAGEGFIQENDGIADACEPGSGNLEDLIPQHVQQGLQQIVQIVEVLVKGRAATVPWPSLSRSTRRCTIIGGRARWWRPLPGLRSGCDRARERHRHRGRAPKSSSLRSGRLMNYPYPCAPGDRAVARRGPRLHLVSSRGQARLRGEACIVHFGRIIGRLIADYRPAAARPPGATPRRSGEGRIRPKGDTEACAWNVRFCSQQLLNAMAIGANQAPATT